MNSPFTVIMMARSAPAINGQLSRYLTQVASGTFVGTLNDRIRESLWKKIVEDEKIQAAMVYQTKTEQGFEILTYQWGLQAVDYDGLTLLTKPSSVIKNKDADSEAEAAALLPASYVVLDCETTGLYPKNDKIIEIGWLKVIDGEICEERHSLIQIDIRVPKLITGITGITTRDCLISGKPFVDVLERLIDTVQDLPVVGHNIGFDLDFLREAAMRHKTDLPVFNSIDTLSMAREILPGLDSYKLADLAATLHVDQKQVHRTKEDCKIALSVFEKLKEIALGPKSLSDK